ncbi:MAG: COG4223 family protein [Caulobacterales bacterium]
MSAAPDPVELAPSRDPAAYGRRPLFTATFFAWVSLCLLCIVAGVAVGRLQFTPAASPAPLSLDAARRPANAESAAPAALAPEPLAAPAAGSADVNALSDRVARLEGSSTRAADAAAMALAAASLSQAAQSSGPFDQDLVAFQRLAPTSSDLKALGPLAARGAPSRAALAAALPALAAEASVAAHGPAKGAGLVRKTLSLIGRVVMIRRVDPNGGGADGALAKAEQQADAGDLEGAVGSLQRLSVQAREPLKDWIDAAQRRIEIDRRIEALRAQALADLTAATGARS